MYTTFTFGVFDFMNERQTYYRLTIFSTQVIEFLFLFFSSAFFSNTNKSNIFNHFMFFFSLLQLDVCMLWIIFTSILIKTPYSFHHHDHHLFILVYFCSSLIKIEATANRKSSFHWKIVFSSHVCIAFLFYRF